MTDLLTEPKSSQTSATRTGLMDYAIDWVEHGRIPDSLIRKGIQRLLRDRLREIGAHDSETMAQLEQAFAESMRESAIAPLAHKANDQHYEVPTEFFRKVLGPHLKYSCCYWDADTISLEQAEQNALRLTCEHAAIEDGMDILELGCGWGSLTLWLARQYPGSRITAVSNSAVQKRWIEQQLQQQQLHNVTIITADMNDFTTQNRFDRIVSVEMFEHMRNYPLLFQRISTWLKPGGKFFMHIFCHRAVPYAFESRDASDWMSQYFFSGGMMPSDDLPLHFQQHLRFSKRWRWDGLHYQKTSNAWLAKMDQQRDSIMPILAETYGDADAKRWWMRWRLFFMACAELFAYRNGQEWWVSHYLFERASD